MITFHIPGPLRSFSGGRSDVELKGNAGTVSEALEALWAACPGMRDRVVTEQGQVREHINIFVGKENIRYTGGLATPVSAGAEISIVPAISGGKTAEEPEPRRGAQSAKPGSNSFANVAGKKYLSLASFRKNGQAVRTPLWFAEQDGKLYFMTRDDSWKFKRIRSNPRVLVAPCTMRGRITGPDVEGRARILEPWEFPPARRALERKYWLMRLPLWSKHNIFLEVTAYLSY
ncbi:MAG TPA: ubiquitin-like small modifier protein 1 [Terriglobales bacterium]|nr:ubiquitin-like small modifier protein 1 [Terriglobales bacterium]